MRLSLMNLERIEVALTESRHALTQELLGLEQLVGSLLCYAQSLPGFVADDLLVLAGAQLAAETLRPHDPLHGPLERLEAMLRSQAGSPVDPAEIDKESRLGFPYPPLSAQQALHKSQTRRPGG